VTGYKFVAPTGYDLQPFTNGGNFGRLTNLLIANYPTVTIHYSNATTARHAVWSGNAAWSEMVSDALTLFGLQLGDPSRVTYSSSYQPQNLVGEYSQTLSPQIVPVPPMQQTAHVIGGSFDFPA
jgi:hypothetical protein